MYPTPADRVEGALEIAKVFIFITIKIKIITIIAKVAMPSEDDLNPTPADQIQDAGVDEDGYIMVGEYSAVDIDGTPADKVQGAVEINKVIILIKISINKINVQVVLPPDIAIDLTPADLTQGVVQINKVLVFIKIFIKIIKINVQVVMHYDIAVDATFDNQVQGALEIKKVIFSSKLKSNQNH